MSFIKEQILSSVEIEPSLSAKRSIIWLHGLGADGNDFVPIVPELHLPEALAIRFIFPHAPTRPVTINNGAEMRAWYDILSLSTTRGGDETGITDSILAIEKIIHREETRGVPSQNILLAGFSQGAVIALHTGLRYQKPLAGIVALSGYLPLPLQIPRAISTIPIFMAHGKQDPIVPFSLGLSADRTLEQLGYDVDWHSYDMPHSVCAMEINDMSQWIQDIFK